MAISLLYLILAAYNLRGEIRTYLSFLILVKLNSYGWIARLLEIVRSCLRFPIG